MFLYLCVKADEDTRYPASDNPTCGKVQSHLCWLMKATSAANFSLSAETMTLHTEVRLEITACARKCGGSSTPSHRAFLRLHSRLGSCSSDLSSPLIFLLLSPTRCEGSCMQQLVKTVWLREGGNSFTLSCAEEKFIPPPSSLS